MEILVEFSNEAAVLIFDPDAKELRLEYCQPSTRGAARKPIFRDSVARSTMWFSSDTRLSWRLWQMGIAGDDDSHAEAARFVEAVNSAVRVRPGSRTAMSSRALSIAGMVETFGWIFGLVGVVGGIIVAVEFESEGLGLGIAFSCAIQAAVVVLLAAYVKARLAPEDAAPT